MSAIDRLAQQWSVVLAARLFDCQVQPNEKSNTVNPAIVERGKAIHSRYDADIVKRMFKSFSTIANQFVTNDRFPELFVALLVSAHDILLLPLGDPNAVKAKTLHTKQIVGNAKMSPLEMLRCEVFEFLSALLQTATKQGASLGAVNKEAVAAVFRFVEHDQPNKVRACAGKILAVLSCSAGYLEEISTTFWAKFSKLKKEADFRNFSAWIDGVVGLEMTLDDPGRAKAGIAFLAKFSESTKKLERGVLRMKFLEALSAMIAKMGKSKEGKENVELLNKELEKIWATVMKWSKKDKHTEFCYKFLIKVLACTPKMFFVRFGAQLLPELMKHAKDGSVESLKMVADYVKTCPSDYEELPKAFKTNIIPFLFPAKENKYRVRFQEDAQKTAEIQILAEVGVKRMDVFFEFAGPVFKVQEPDAHVRDVRLVVIKAVYKMCQINEKICVAHNNEFMVWLEPILKKAPGSTEQEFEAAIFPFPFLRPQNGELQRAIVAKLFDASFENPTAFNSLCLFVDKYSQDDGNLRLPIDLMTKLLQGIATKDNDAIMKRLSLLIGLLGAYASCLQRSKEIIAKIPEGKVPLTTGHWVEFRSKVDSETLILLMNPGLDIRQLTYDFLIMLREPAFQEVDRVCLPQTFFSLSKWCEEIPRDKDIFPYVRVICDNSSVSAAKYFDIVMACWTANNALTKEYQINIIKFLALVAMEDHDNVRAFLLKLFDSSKTLPNCVQLVLGLLAPDLWERVMVVLDEWMTANSITHYKLWTGIVAIHYTLAQRAEFPDVMEKGYFSGCYKKFCRRFWEEHAKLLTNFSTVEKTFKTLQLVVEKTNVKVLVASEDISKFVQAICAMAPLKKKDKFPPSYIDTLLAALVSIFKYLTFTEKESFGALKKFMLSLLSAFEKNDRIHYLVTQLVTMILAANPQFLFDVFEWAMEANVATCTAGVLSLGNVLCCRDDFLAAYDNGAAVILAATITNMCSSNIVVRQAAFKLMCLMMSRSEGIYNQEVPAHLMMPLTSPSPVGFTIQTDNFVVFVSKYMKPEITLNMFDVMSETLSRKTEQAALVNALIRFVSGLVESAPMETTMNMLIKLAGQCSCDDAETAMELKNLYFNYLQTFKKKFDGEQMKLIQAIFDFGVAQESLLSNESRTAVILLSYVFSFYPEETAEFLLSFALRQYDASLPDLSDFCQFLNTASVELVADKSEIVAQNALSQMFLMIESKEQFVSLFGKHIELLLLAATMSKSSEEATMGQFHPLLDSLIDAVLFRFASDREQFSANLQTLQEMNIINRATSLGEQYSIGTDAGVHTIVAYDNKLVSTLVELFGQFEPDFTQKFLAKLLPFAFKVRPMSARAVEPFMMIMAISKDISDNSYFYLLLFTVYVFRTNRTDIMDCLVDCLRTHILELPLDSQSLEVETMPTVMVLIMYLSLPMKTSLAVHIMDILCDIVTKVRESQFRDSIFAEIVGQIRETTTPKHIVQHFVKFLREARSMSDESVKKIIIALDVLSTLYDDPNDWFSLLALVTDGIRFIIGHCSSSQLPRTLEKYSFSNAEEFSELLLSTFTDADQRQFVISFLCNVVSTFKNIDLFKDAAVLCILAELCKDISVISDSIYDDLYRFISLVCVTCNDPWRMKATGLLAQMLQKKGVAKSARSLIKKIPTFVKVKQKGYGRQPMMSKTVISPTCLPVFDLAPDAQSDENVFDNLWNFICDKIGQTLSFDVPETAVVQQPVTEEESGVEEEEVVEPEEKSSSTKEEQHEAPKADQTASDESDSSDSETEETSSTEDDTSSTEDESSSDESSTEDTEDSTE